FDAAQRGITPTFLYELLDEAADPSNTDPQLHYGLFNADGSPKPVATALHNLTTMLTAANATPGIPPVVSLRLGNAPETAQTMTLTGAAGTTIVAVWAEPPIWDPITHTEIVAPLVQTEIDLGSTVASVQVLDPLAGTRPIASYANVSRLTVSISDHPLLIQLSAAVPVVVPTRPIVTPPSIGETTLPIGATTSEAAGAAVTSAAPPQVPAASTTGVYRFFNTGDGTHFYTASITEAQTVQRTRADLVPEGVGLRAIGPAAPDAAAAPVYRFFDSASGTQFLTASTTERDTLIATRTDLRYEPASIFYEHAAAQPGDTAVFRFFDTVHGTHFYTDSAAERAAIITTRADLVAEGIGFYEPPAAS
ncbi:MAG: hypothetical protein M3N26_10135, partial [Pseudomonadota bacterium]|nr:hypothetical protein [Pseudomonadota bacterium]